jgi:hypothetical protein
MFFCVSNSPLNAINKPQMRKAFYPILGHLDALLGRVGRIAL